MFKNTGLGKKVFAIVGLLSTVTVVVAAVGIYQLSSLNRRVNVLTQIQAPAQALAAELNTDRLRIGRDLREAVIETDGAKGKEIAKSIDSQYSQVAEKIAKLRSLLDSNSVKDLDAFEALFKQLEEWNREALRLSALNSGSKARQLSRTEGLAAFEKSQQNLKELATLLASKSETFEAGLAAKDLALDMWLLLVDRTDPHCRHR